MKVDYYYSLLMKAVAGKDPAARDRIYKDAYGVIRKSDLTREAAASHAAALETAIRQIEDEIAAEDNAAVEETKSATAIGETLSRGRNWRPLVFAACAVLAVLAISSLLYGYVVTRGPGFVGAGVKA
jgi:hypothetical protein